MRDKIYKQTDSKVKSKRSEKIAFANKKGYKYFSEYVVTEYETRPSVDIIKEVRKGTGYSYTPNTLYGLIKRTRERIEDAEAIQYVKIKRDGVCIKCKKRKIAPGNWSHCKECERQNNAQASIFNCESYGTTNFTG